MMVHDQYNKKSMFFQDIICHQLDRNAHDPRFTPDPPSCVIFSYFAKYLVVYLRALAYSRSRAAQSER